MSVDQTVIKYYEETLVLVLKNTLEAKVKISRGNYSLLYIQSSIPYPMPESFED